MHHVFFVLIAYSLTKVLLLLLHYHTYLLIVLIFCATDKQYPGNLLQHFVSLPCKYLYIHTAHSIPLLLYLPSGLFHKLGPGNETLSAVCKLHTTMQFIPPITQKLIKPTMFV